MHTMYTSYDISSLNKQLTRFYYPNVTTLRSDVVPNPSVVVCLSLTLIHTTEPVEIFRNFLGHFVPYTFADRFAKFYGDRFRVTSPSRVKRKRGSKIYPGNSARYGLGYNW